MTAGFFRRAPHVALLIGVVLFATATLTFAATSTTPQPSVTPPAASATTVPLEVPDVRGQAYVFAKGTLEESGFAWRVDGPVEGFAANTVAGQKPAPGARVVAKGAPIVVLRLSENTSYKQEGVPENAAPYAGVRAVLVGAKKTTLAPAKPRPAAKKQAPKRALKKKQTPERAPTKAKRTPAFTVAGAPPEPLDEITLAARAKRLAAWVEAHPQRSPAHVRHWLYQHAWIVTGARFGWSTGPEALRTLVAVDRRVQKLWGLGGRSEAVAQNALAFVEKRSR